jgi:acetate kinase
VPVLVINCGSSSLKYQLFEMATERTLASGMADRVGINGGVEASLTHKPAGGEPIVKAVAMPDHSVAFGYVVEALTDPVTGSLKSMDEIRAVGHRVVHGGERFTESVLIDDAVMAAIEDCAALAPLHNPANLTGIRACKKYLPKVPHVAVFDTAFHQTMPQHAWMYGITYELYEEHHLRRYGFHGTSHRYVTGVAAEMLEAAGIPKAEQKIITCHLGNGCSMAAVKGGKSVDTSMGFTPLEGLLMGTRCGDLDPAIVRFLVDTLGMTADDVDAYLNKRCGLLGVSGVSSDMRDVKAAAAEGNMRARVALDLFTYRVRKYVGAYGAAMGGLDAVVFTAGIGENDPKVRRESMHGMEFMGIELDDARNEDLSLRGKPVEVNKATSRVKVYVIPTDEELLIARDTDRVVAGVAAAE